jgi:parvulin-like peptidyl-prolyl isomerase
MPLIINDETVPAELIRDAENQISKQAPWQGMPDGAEKNKGLRAAAEAAVIGSILIQQFASSDTRPLDAAAVQKQVDARLKTAARTATATNAGDLRALLVKQVEREMRGQRAIGELSKSAPAPAPEQASQFYEKNQENFRIPAAVHAAHLAKHVNAAQSEHEARAVIEEAFAELGRGLPFGEAVERYSDCRDNGGDLGWFRRGTMVEEFDEVVFALAAGERSGIFRTQFGFHIAEVREVREDRSATFEEVKADIERVLIAMAQHHVVMAKVLELRASATVVRVGDQMARQSA